MSWTWIVLGTNISKLNASSEPIHGESVGRNSITNVMIPAHDMPGVFGILVTFSHRNGTFGIEEHGSGR